MSKSLMFTSGPYRFVGHLLLVAALFGLLLIFGTLTKHEPKFEQESVEQSVEQKIPETKPSLDQATPSKPDSTKAEKSVPRGTTPENKILTNSEFFDELLAEYNETVMAKVPDGKNRTDMIIRYYPHENDINITETLGKYKFYLHERPVDSLTKPTPSNSIYFGDSVDTKDIQIIAYTLLQNGFPLKQITPSQFHDSWKASSVEIGADTSMGGQIDLTLSQVRNFKNPFVLKVE
ncbi:MAG: hypothetical protein JXQ90_20745 [Cyclobacteriaceae bacterium]